MNLSLSNIAWASEDDAHVYALLKKYGYQGVDIAPSRVWSNPASVTESDFSAFKETLQPYGLTIAGMQSLLFGHPELTLFDSVTARNLMQSTLMHMIDIGNGLGVRALVFGSPKNRIMGEVTPEKWDIAREFFQTLGEYARTKDVLFCIEANPTIYGGDFLTASRETFEFVKSIDSPGLRVNLDFGTILENDEDGEALVHEYAPYIGHVQISMPKLAPIVLTASSLSTLKALTTVGYQGWAAIEMVRTESDEEREVIEKILQDVAQTALKIP